MSMFSYFVGLLFFAGGINAVYYSGNLTEPLEKFYKKEYANHWLTFFISLPCLESNGNTDTLCSMCYQKGLNALQNVSRMYNYVPNMQLREQRLTAGLEAVNYDTVEEFQKCSDDYNKFPWSFNNTFEYLNETGRTDDSFVSFCHRTNSEFYLPTENVARFSHQEGRIYLPFYFMTDLLFNVTKDSESHEIKQMREKLCELKSFRRFIEFSQAIIELVKSDEPMKSTAITQPTKKHARRRTREATSITVVSDLYTIEKCLFTRCGVWIPQLFSGIKLNKNIG